MSKYKFEITYRNENEYGQYWGDNRYTVSIIAETLEQAKQKLDAIAKNDYRMHKNILEWKADEIIEEKDKEIERLNNIINEFDDFITNVDSHINLGDESEEFILVRDKWLELQELKGSDKE